MGISRVFTITESAYRIHNPIISDTLVTFGAALRLEFGARIRGEVTMHTKLQ